MRDFCVILLIAISAISCNDSSSELLFKLVNPEKSGLDFKNELIETEDTNIINLEYYYNGGGVAVGDFNNDGLNDVFFTGNMVSNKLYINKGGLTFEDITEAAGVEGYNKWKSGVAVVDINGDGLLDLYVCATIAPDSTARTNMLFINQGISEGGIPSFKDEAARYGINDSGYSSNAAFFDYDKDDDLDLFILSNSRQRGPVNYRPKVNDGSSINTDKLYRNNGNGTFTDVSKQAGIRYEGYALGLAFLDVNRDGWIDIYVCNDYITNDLLYVNDGNGRFENRIDAYITHQSKFSMGADVADINNDGHLDLITVDMLPDNNLRKKTVISGSGYITYINDEKFGYAHQYVRNMLQLSNGDATFSEIGQLAGVHQTEWSWSPLFADFDNDGFKDLIITNGFPKDITDRDFISFREQTLGIATTKHLLSEIPSVKVPNAVFRNAGNLVFEDVTKAWGMDHPSFSNGAAYADLDNDGDLDYIVNNVNDVASLYENRLYGSKRPVTENNFLRLKLQYRANNASALGAKVTLYYDGQLQFTEHNIYRGYISSVEDFMHFGLGPIDHVDSIVVQWPDGKRSILRNIESNQVVTVDSRDAVETQNRAPGQEIGRLFKPVAIRGTDFKHQEENKIDFNIQRTLPKKYSQRGPAISVADINGDGLDDFYIGGSSDKYGTMFLQNSNGTFTKTSNSLNEPEQFEDAGTLFFDADNDNDPDLYIVSGTYEYERGSPFLQDRLYINDGSGRFDLSRKALPQEASSGSCVRAADFDSDGDLDLFVGGNVSLGNYPYADSSFVLVNQGGHFRKATIPDLASIGIVNDAIWTDFDNDGRFDLVVVGEYMPVSFFRNTEKGLELVKATGVEKQRGWFNSIAGGDFDNDGDTDYVVGNLGLNNHYSVSEKHPMKMHAKDFDGNGSIDAILSCYIKSDGGDMKLYPVHFWDELNSQSPKFRKKFSTYREFASTTTDKFFSVEELNGALQLEANHMATSFIENLGNGKFSMKALPVEAQFGPVNGIVVDDVDSDGSLDVVMIGNDFGNEPTMGQYSAFVGLVLKGDGKNNFSPVRQAEDGFLVRGDGKALASLVINRRRHLLAAQNRDSLKVFTLVSNPSTASFSPGRLDTHAEVFTTDGAKRRVEFYYGSSYLSQSGRNVFLPENMQRMTVFSSDGRDRQVVKNLAGY